ncbi:hypothetical protein ONS95_012654 [Cadophora gregata]|uniref:uncharacterized protein n=1 Tax=Cadophora gregata TaxID=51156 RepID=UPI0026DB699E|nr:uncharacterized protein ONS95_012654 [Cadophora gregata]KAK0118366.1 hypothetical protein ONS95_012654 [Cadophora gregata]KAK0123435.1 hypothetical protein ONS96_010418 [Cadophora gregata f. sp. sojae]
MPLKGLLRHVTMAGPKGKTASSSSSSKTPPSFPQFPNLPLEIRQKIWRETIPGPRVMLITLSKSKPGIATTKPASYGGRHPALLSVDRVSRAEGLRILHPRFNAFWNFDLDIPYFEIKDNSDDNVVLLAQLAREGLLNEFRTIAVDWMLWRWQMATQTMEFRVTFGNKFGGYEHPIITINALPNIKRCSFIYTDHTLQADLVTGKPWSLGLMTEQTALTDEWAVVEADMARQVAKLKETGKIGEWNPLNIKLRRGVEIDFCGIHGRERECLPKDKLKRPLAGWEMDWFG